LTNSEVSALMESIPPNKLQYVTVDLPACDVIRQSEGRFFDFSWWFWSREGSKKVIFFLLLWIKFSFVTWQDIYVPLHEL